MRCEEAQELITALVDDEISAPERTAIESHMKDCEACRLAYRREQALKKEIKTAGARLSAPAELREKILADAGHAPAAALDPRRWQDLLRHRRRLRPAFALATLALLILPGVYLFHLTGKSPSLAVLETHQRIVRGDLQFTRGASADEIREHLAGSIKRKFAPMEYDLSRLNLRAVGGATQEIQGREVLVTVYEGAIPSLTCYTLLGTEKDAPPNSRVFFDPEKRINFYTFSQDGVNGVLHQEGELICILVSKMPAETLLQVARANASPSRET